VLQVLVEAQSKPGLPREAGQRRLAHLDPVSAQVDAVWLQQVEA
jgi:hypothetical protein